jgi:EmrB/QacA subfamily drug resistance transporter
VTPALKRVLNALLFGAFMVSMDRTIVSIALPSVVADLNATSSYAWIASAYIFAGALVLPVAGRLLDIKNGKRLMLAAISVFVLGSVLCGVAVNASMLIAARFIQGLGGGAFLAMGAGMVGLLFEPKDRAVVVGRLGMVLAVASVVGPVVGGTLTHHLGWRSIFFVNVPTGLAVLIVLWRFLEDVEPASEEPMDWWGALGVALWTLPLLLLTSQADLTSLGDMKLGAAIAVIALAFWIFVTIEKRSANPLFDFAMLKNPVFKWAILGIWWLGAASTSTAMYFPLYLIQVKALSTLHAGLVLTAMVFGVMVGSQLLGLISKKLGGLKPVLLLGTASVSLTLFGLAGRLSVGLPIWEVVLWLMATGLGLGMSVSGFPVVVQNATEKERIGTATASVQFCKAMGAALGTALLGAMMTATLNTAFPKEIRTQLAADSLPSEMALFEEPTKIQSRFQEALKKIDQQIDQYPSADSKSRAALTNHPFMQSVDTGKLESEEGRTELKAFLKTRVDKLAIQLETAASLAFLSALKLVLQGACIAALLAFLLVLPMKEERLETEG